MLSSVHLAIYCVICFALLVSSIYALIPEERVSTLIQTQHAGWKTPWMDVPLHHMPKFKIPDTSVIQVSLPHPVVNGPAIKINPEEDVKVTFTFSGNKVVIPWVLLYDTKHRKSLQLLTITFFHDDFEILHISHQATYGPPIGRLDPGHPSLTSFKIAYKWEAVHENDLGLGVFVMFSMTLGLLVLMVVYVSCTYDRDVNTDKHRGDRQSRAGISMNRSR